MNRYERMEAQRDLIFSFQQTLMQARAAKPIPHFVCNGLFAEQLKDAGIRPNAIGSSVKEVRKLEQNGLVLHLRSELRDMKELRVPENTFVEIVWSMQRIMWERSIDPKKFGSSDAELNRLELKGHTARIGERLDELRNPTVSLERAGSLFNQITSELRDNNIKEHDVGLTLGELAFVRRGLIVQVERLWKRVQAEPDLYLRRAAIRTLRRAITATKIEPTEFGTTLYTIRRYRETGVK